MALFAGNLMAFGIGSMFLGVTFIVTCLFALLGRNGTLEGPLESFLGAFICLTGVSITAFFYAVALAA